MPTLEEVRLLIAQKAGQTSYVEATHIADVTLGSLVTGDMWIPCSNAGMNDWVQIGDWSGHYPGKSHILVYGFYPVWADDTAQIP